MCLGSGGRLGGGHEAFEIRAVQTLGREGEWGCEGGNGRGGGGDVKGCVDVVSDVDKGSVLTLLLVILIKSVLMC